MNDDSATTPETTAAECPPALAGYTDLWWLAEVSPHYDYPTSLKDGPHDSIEGVEKAAYLMRALGLQKDKKYCAVRVVRYDVTPRPHDVNHEAVRDVRRMVSERSV